VFVVEAEFTFLQVEVEHFRAQSLELSESVFGIAPEGLDTVDVVILPGELIVAMIDPKVLLVANIYKPIIATPAIRVDHAGDIHLAADNRLQTGLGAIWNDLGVDIVATFEYSKHGSFTTGTAAALAADSFWSKVGFVNLDDSLEGRLLLADFRHADAQEEQNAVDSIPVQVDKLADRNCVKIERKMHDQLPELPLRNSGTQDVLVLWLLHSA